MTTLMTASARELRHMVGRYLHAAQLPGYAVNAVRDAVLAAQAEGYDAVSDLETRRGLLADAPTSFTVDGVELDGRGGPLAVLVPALIDELLLAVHASGPESRATVRVRNVLDPGLVRALHDHASVRGLAYEARLLGPEIEVTARPASPPARTPARGAFGPSMERALREGYELPVEQFWRLFHESNLALTPDSEISRTHAGSQVRNERGEVIGELDEEAYTYIRGGQQVSEQVPS